MNVEKNLISKVLHEDDIVTAIDAKITVEFFEDEDNAMVWEFILGYKQDYGSIPTLKVIRDECDGWKPYTEVKEPFEYLIERLRDQRKRKIIGEAVTAAGAALNDDPEEAQSYLQHALAQVGTEISTLRDENLVTTFKERLSAYEELEKLDGGLRGLPTGFRTIDRATSGLQGGQLVVLIGPPKAGKSTTLLAIAKAVHDGGNRPLFIGFEMSNQEQEARYDSMVAKISFTRLTNGRLHEDEWERLEKELNARKSMPPFILSADISATTTLAGIDAKIDQYQPSVVLIDGVYMMETPEIQADPGSPQSLTYLSRNLKRMAQRRDLPVVVTTQATEHRYSRRAGLKAKDVYGTSGFAQDCDVMLGAEDTDDERIKRLRVVIARSCPKIFTDVLWDWDNGTFEEQWGGTQDEEDEEVDGGAFD